jgi:hypothetical protein
MGEFRADLQHGGLDQLRHPALDPVGSGFLTSCSQFPSCDRKEVENPPPAGRLDRFFESTPQAASAALPIAKLPTGAIVKIS